MQCPFPSRKIKLTGESPGGTGGRAFRIHEEGNLMACIHVCVCWGGGAGVSRWVSRKKQEIVMMWWL